MVEPAWTDGWPVNRDFLLSFLVTFLLTVALVGGAATAVFGLWGRQRETFRTPYFEFELAKGWTCHRDETEYVCEARGTDKTKAVAIVTLKERSPADSLDAYLQFIRRPRSGGSLQPASSSVHYARRIRLGDREWVESLHSGSEVPNYDTYYLATTTSLVGILFTLSTHATLREAQVGELRTMGASVRTYQR